MQPDVIPNSRRKNWIVFASLASIFCLALALRLFRLGKQALWFDEAWSWNVTQLPLDRMLSISKFEPNFPPYYLILKAWQVVFRDSEASLRGLSVLFSMAAFTIVLILTYRWWGFKASLFASFFTACSSFAIYYAQEVRFYAYLGFLIVAVYWLLIEAFGTDQRLFLPWGIVNASLAVSHTYGLVFAGVFLAFTLLYWLILKVQKINLMVSASWLISGVLISLIGILPALWLVLTLHFRQAGGAWIPEAIDLVHLFNLVSLGTQPVVSSFPGGISMMVPFLKGLSTFFWLIPAIILIGSITVWGFFKGLRSDLQHKTLTVLALCLIIVPILIAFLYSKLTNQAGWAYKPFLGTAYIVYIFAGVGLASASFRGIQAAALVGYSVFAFLSLAPYYLTWEKSDARTAFYNKPPGEGVILMEPGYLFPLPFYYGGTDKPIWGIAAQNDPKFPLQEIPFNLLGGEPPVPLGCESQAVKDAQALWVYRDFDNFRIERKGLPGCIRQKPVWYFRAGKWRLYKQ